MLRKTAAELGLPEDVYAALVWVRDALDPTVAAVALPAWLAFDMRNWVAQRTTSSDCGTVACIGGSAQLRMAGLAGEASPKLGVPAGLDYDAAGEVLRSEAVAGKLGDLFYDYEAVRPRDVRRAVAALDRVLGGQLKNPWLVDEHGVGLPGEEPRR